MGTEDEKRFRRVYEAAYEPLMAYALRRVEQPADAADVVAETFLIAWRRGRQMPDGGEEVTLWLYGVARRVLANHYRGGMRREKLGERLRQRLRETVTSDPGFHVAEGVSVRSMLRQLAEPDREVLMLTFWEGLEPREAAVVLGISATVVRTRLSRARARFRALVDPSDAVLPLSRSREKR